MKRWAFGKPTPPSPRSLMADFATAWQAANKVVYSTTWPRCKPQEQRLEHRFDPASVRDLKAFGYK